MKARSCVAVIAGAVLLLAVPVAHAAFPGANGKIGFTRGSGAFPSCGDIYSMNADGGGVTPLTSSSACEGGASWSPDGGRIAFMSAVNPPTKFDNGVRFEDSVLEIMNADGSGRAPLAGAEVGYSWPDWSPDGQTLAAENSQIQVLYADGSGHVSYCCYEFGSEPAIDPDGNYIVAGPNDIQLFRMSLSASPVYLTSGPPVDFDPVWSPDGSKIAFSRSEQGAPPDIYVMNRDGSDLVNLTSDPRDDRLPAWSPDSSRIAFTRCCFVGSTAEIFAMKPNGSSQRRLTNNSVDDWDPAWESIPARPYTWPVGASPTRLPLVVAFTPCDPPGNARHSYPLSTDYSCNPPVPRSSLVAVGSQSLGFTRMIVLGSSQCAPFDSAHCYPDVTIRFNITDVRSGSSTGPEYGTPSAQDLTGIATLPQASEGSTIQITDQDNQPLSDPTAAYDRSATTTPFSFPVPIDCADTADPGMGSVCGAQTTANTLVPGSVVAGKRAVWETGQFEVLDQGDNGVPGDADDQPFEVQGVFVP